MSRPKGTGGIAKALTVEEIKRIDKCISGTKYELRNRALLYLNLGSGFRISEAVGLMIADVYNGKVRSEIILEKHSTKSRKSRTVYLSEQAQLHLKKYLESRTNKDPSSPLFPSQKDRRLPLRPNAGVQLLKKMFVAAGVDQASSHSLRRTHANSLRRQGVDLRIIKDQLGHSSLAVLDKYLSVDPVEAARAVAGLRF